MAVEGVAAAVVAAGGAGGGVAGGVLDVLEGDAGLAGGALCRAAGADPDAIPSWIAEGKRRRARAALPPFSGGLRPRQ